MDDVCHLVSNCANLGRSCISRLLDLVRPSLSEGDGEEANEVIVSGLDGNVGLDQSLPLAHQGTQLVRGEVQAMKIGKAVFSLNLVHTESDFAECVVLVLLKIS